MMKVINISGDNQSGRTRALIDFVSCQAQEFNSKCLVVCPTNERVANLNQRCRLNQSSEFFNNVKFIGSSSFNMECISSNYDVIAFDGIEKFNKNDEGCYKMLASSRLARLFIRLMVKTLELNDGCLRLFGISLGLGKMVITHRTLNYEYNYIYIMLFIFY